MLTRTVAMTSFDPTPCVGSPSRTTAIPVCSPIAIQNFSQLPATPLTAHARGPAWIPTTLGLCSVSVPMVYVRVVRVTVSDSQMGVMMAVFSAAIPFCVVCVLVVLVMFMFMFVFMLQRFM